MTKLSIIILSYNTKNLLLKCVQSVIREYGEQIKRDELELIVVDNDSVDDSVQAIEKIKEVKLIKNRENFGFSKGNNIGARQAKGEYILFLNSDTKVEDQGFLKMVDFLDQNRKIGILGGKLLNSDGSQQLSCGNFYNLFNLTVTLLGGERIGLIRKKFAKIQKVDWVSGASLMIRKKLFEKLNGFDENLFMYMEDMELCFRAKKLGFQTYFYPDIRIVHQELGSSNRAFAVNQIYKGLLYFYKKHKPYWQYLIAKALLIMKALAAVLIGSLTNNNYLKKTYTGALKFAI